MNQLHFSLIRTTMVDIQVATKASNLLLVSYPAQTFHMLCRKIVCGHFQYVGNMRPKMYRHYIATIRLLCDSLQLTPTITDLTCMLTGPSFPNKKCPDPIFLWCGTCIWSSVVCECVVILLHKCEYVNVLCALSQLYNALDNI